MQTNVLGLAQPREAIVLAARETGAIVTVEEYTTQGVLGDAVPMAILGIQVCSLPRVQLSSGLVWNLRRIKAKMCWTCLGLKTTRPSRLCSLMAAPMRMTCCCMFQADILGRKVVRARNSDLSDMCAAYMASDGTTATREFGGRLEGGAGARKVCACLILSLKHAAILMAG